MRCFNDVLARYKYRGRTFVFSLGSVSNQLLMVDKFIKKLEKSFNGFEV